MMDFFVKHLLGKTVDARFDRFPTQKELDDAAQAAAAGRGQAASAQYVNLRHCNIH